MGPGGPAANPFSAFDALCPGDACRAAGLPQCFVGLADLTLYARVVDIELGGPQPALALERAYNQESSADGPFGKHWTFNLGESLTVGADASVTVERGSGRTDRFAPAPGSGSYFAVTSTTDTLSRDSAGRWTARAAEGTTRVFSPDGRLTGVSDGGVPRFTLDYDGNGRLAAARSRGRSLRFTWDGSHITSVGDSAGRTVSYAYNGDGNLTQQIDPGGQTVSYQYSDAGLLTAVSAGAAVTAIAYNTDETYVSVASATTPDGATRTYDMPRNPREIRVTDGAGNPALYTSTALGQVESATDAAGVKTSFTYDSAGRRTRIVNGAGETVRIDYDAAGNPTALVDGAGNRWTAEYTAGRVSHIGDANRGGWSFGYDNAGNLASLVAADGAFTGIERNAAGAVLSVTTPGQTSTWQYDSDGMVSRFTDAAGNAVGFGYDGAGRLNSRKAGDNAALQFEYGSAPAPTGAATGDARLPLDDPNIVRDAQGRVTTATDSFGNQVKYAWTAAGRLARISLPGDRSIAYEYDRAGRLAKVSDWAGNFAVYRYDSAGYPASLNVSGGPVTIYQYDAARNLKTILSTGPDGAPVAGYRYTLDGNANRTAIGALEPSAQAPAGAAVRFAYNAVNRPVSRDDGATYRYDSRGNLAAVQGTVNLAFEYDPFGRLAGISGDVSSAYAYTGAGLRVARTAGGRTRRMVYDLSSARPRLLLETDENNAPVAWYISGAVPLWKLSADGKPYFYHYDGDGNVVAVSSPTAGVVNRYAYDPLGRLTASDEGVENPWRARAAAGVVDDGNGILFTGSAYLHVELGVVLPGSLDTAPPRPELTPPLPPAGACLWQGIAACALASGRLQ